MNFDFSAEQKQLRDEFQRFLTDRGGRAAARRVMENGQAFDRELWRQVAELGWAGIAIPEPLGGVGLGYLELCLLAGELGRSLAPLPMSSSIYLCAEALLRGASPEQQRDYLPKLASGALIGTLAYSEGLGFPTFGSQAVRFADGKLNGVKWPVADGDCADIAVVLASNAEGGDVLALVELQQAGVAREALETLDPSRPQASLGFIDARAELLPGDGWQVFWQVLNSAATLFAFEQLGGADACLIMARDFALERKAFGRVIGSCQAIKHKLADMYVNNELTRGNAYYAAWALADAAEELPLAAATARVSATAAYEFAATEALHIHGGMGFTWESDCHLFLRRARALAVNLGGSPLWKRRITDNLEQALVA